MTDPKKAAETTLCLAGLVVGRNLSMPVLITLDTYPLAPCPLA